MGFTQWMTALEAYSRVNTWRISPKQQRGLAKIKRCSNMSIQIDYFNSKNHSVFKSLLTLHLNILQIRFYPVFNTEKYVTALKIVFISITDTHIVENYSQFFEFNYFFVVFKIRISLSAWWNFHLICKWRVIWKLRRYRKCMIPLFGNFALSNLRDQLGCLYATNNHCWTTLISQ